MDQGMQYPAEVGVNAYVRVKLSFLGQQVSGWNCKVCNQFILNKPHTGEM